MSNVKTGVLLIYLFNQMLIAVLTSRHLEGAKQRLVRHVQELTYCYNYVTHLLKILTLPAFLHLLEYQT